MGWDADRFPEEVDSELICCICTGVLEDPVESPCRHVFCSKCVKPWVDKNSTCPQCRGTTYQKDLKPVLPILKNIINKQKIYCEYKEIGCEKVLTIETVRRHLKNCPFAPKRIQRDNGNISRVTQLISQIKIDLPVPGNSRNPWYLRDENAELEFLRRHKKFAVEIKTSSALTWLQNGAFGDFESERDAQLCLSRSSHQLGFYSKCDGCHKDILGIKYRCLECRDMDLCEFCNRRVAIPVGHDHFHKMAEMRVTCDGCGLFIIQTQFHCTVCFDFDLCLDCHERNVFPERHRNTHKMIKKNLLTGEILPSSQPETRPSSQNISDKVEDEIALCKRHKKYFEDVERITSAIWCRNREYESLDVIRDMNLFMSRYSTSGQFVSTCDGCASPLPWQKYRCLDCFDLDLCGGCYLSGKRPNGHLNTHKTVELRIQCDGCHALIIQNLYKCDVCYDFDLCADCYRNGNFPESHSRNHSVTISNLLNEDFPYYLFDNCSDNG